MNNTIIYSKLKDAAEESKKQFTVALVGNPNSGKTTLFNLLTGSKQKVGNWPGVTVEKKSGACIKQPRLHIVDTPGCYSLSAFTPEEQITAKFVKEGRPDLILNVVDSTNLERNLVLTTQLLELGVPVVVALNMQDEAQARGISVDEKQLEKVFGCPFASVSAAKNKGTEKLVKICLDSAVGGKATARTFDSAERRYETIRLALNNAVVASSGATSATEKIDKILLNKWLAFPLFALIMTAVFYLSVGGPVGMLGSLINEKLTPLLQFGVKNALASAPSWLSSLVCDGVIGGVMSVVGFLPQVMALFGCIALLEGCGYMSRIAFITDKLLHGLGLGGRSFVCMILGCGCSVPAILSARTIKSDRERQKTITLAPFVPCSAKLALIAFFTAYAFGGNAMVAVSFYFASVIAIILGGLALNLFKKKDPDDIFLMELPPYRLPNARNAAYQMWERGKAFLLKAGTIIFAASVVLWALTNFDFALRPANAENSILAGFGKAIAPVFYPLGFNDGGCGWQFAVATVSGIAAKETVVATLQILLPQGIGGAISPLGAYAFVLYNLLTIPCVAAVSASFAEQGGWKKGLRSAAFQILSAYILSLAVYQIGRLLLQI